MRYGFKIMQPAHCICYWWPTMNTKKRCIGQKTRQTFDLGGPPAFSGQRSLNKRTSRARNRKHTQTTNNCPTKSEQSLRYGLWGRKLRKRLLVGSPVGCGTHGWTGGRSPGSFVGRSLSMVSRWRSMAFVLRGASRQILVLGQVGPMERR